MGVIGFRILYERPEERYAFLDLHGINLMLEEAAGRGRRFRTAALEYPYGRGVNFQIGVTNVDALYDRVLEAQLDPVIPIEERWYRRDGLELGNRQFVVADPDGYLLRFYSDLGQRKAVRL